jgi:hypothetical protein
VACRTKQKLHWTQFLAVLRDSGDEPDSAETGKVPSLSITLYQENEAKTKQMLGRGTSEMEEIFPQKKLRVEPKVSLTQSDEGCYLQDS